MKSVKYISPGGLFEVDLDASDQKSLFKGLAAFQEVFESDTCCGACKGKEIRFVVRTNDHGDFYELHCLDRDCRARLSFGVHKQGGTLFPHRKDKEGRYLPNNGWLIYKREDEGGGREEKAAPPPAGKSVGGNGVRW